MKIFKRQLKFLNSKSNIFAMLQHISECGLLIIWTLGNSLANACNPAGHTGVLLQVIQHK